MRRIRIERVSKRCSDLISSRSQAERGKVLRSRRRRYYRGSRAGGRRQRAMSGMKVKRKLKSRRMLSCLRLGLEDCADDSIWSRWIGVQYMLYYEISKGYQWSASIQQSSLWNFKTSFPHAHHPDVRFRAKISNASYFSFFITCSKILFRLGFRE